MKTWTDQPNKIDDYPILCSVSVHVRNDSVQVEIRKDPFWATVHYLTAGNLFGSQTVECKNAATVFKLIDALNKGRVAKGDLPDGCALMTNS